MDKWGHDLGVGALERELRAGLRHESAPEGFAERVLARTAQRDQRRDGQRGKHPGGAGLAHKGWLTAAAIVLAVGGGDLMHVWHHRQAAAAQAQVDLAMQVTSRALAQVEADLNRTPAGRYTQMLGNR